MPTVAQADHAFIATLERLGISVVASLAPDLLACFGAEDGALTQSFTGFSHPFGLSFRGGCLAVSARRSIEMFALSTRLAATYPAFPGRFDGVFMRVGTHHTGGCATHEVALDGPRVVFVNTLYSCIARSGFCAEAGMSFEPLWQPPFVSALMPEDRCHLNGFALQGGRMHFATCFACSDAFRGYRDQPLDAGVVLDVATGRPVLEGLIKPHSPRLIEGALYVLNSGAGEVLRLAAPGQSPLVLARLDGFTRGLAVVGDVLLVGLSSLRGTALGLDLPVSEQSHQAGIVALDRHSGAVLGRLDLPGSVHEVMDLAVVPGLRRLAVHPLDDTHIPVETPQVSFWTTLPDESPPAPAEKVEVP